MSHLSSSPAPSGVLFPQHLHVPPLHALSELILHCASPSSISHLLGLQLSSLASFPLLTTPSRLPSPYINLSFNLPPPQVTPICLSVCSNMNHFHSAWFSPELMMTLLLPTACTRGGSCSPWGCWVLPHHWPTPASSLKSLFLTSLSSISPDVFLFLPSRCGGSIFNPTPLPVLTS